MPPSSTDERFRRCYAGRSYLFLYDQHSGNATGCGSAALYGSGRRNLSGDDQVTHQLVNGGFCAEPEHVILHVEITRTIHIPEEFAADKCLSTLAREHLEKKAKVNDPVLDDAKSKMLAALQAAIRRGPRMPQRSSKEAVAIFLKDIQVSMEKTIDEITAERARLMASVNTQEENRHLATSCNQGALQ